MRKIALPLTVIGAVLVLLFATGGVDADSITWTAGFQVQNLGTATANITITYYKQDGLVAATQVDTIAPGTSKTYYGATMNVADGFNGSVVITSDQPIVAIANLLTSDPTMAGSYSGVTADATATEVNLPLVMRNHGDPPWNTTISVQNAGPITATVTLAFQPSPGFPGSPDTINDTIPPSAAHRYDQLGQTDLGDEFVGSVVVTSDQPVAAEVNEIETGGSRLMSYTGFSGAGSSTVNIPLVMTQNQGWWTGVQVQNLGTVPTDITITCHPDPAYTTWTPTPETVTNVAPGASANFLQSGGQWTQLFVGSAVVTNSAGQPLVAIVNELKGTDQGMSYSGFDPATATDEVNLPLIMTQNPEPDRWWTGVQVQNLGTVPTDITITFHPAPGLTWTPTPETATNVASGASANLLQTGGQWTQLFVGSAVVTNSAGQPIAAIVNEITVSPIGEESMSYNGFNQ